MRLEEEVKSENRSNSVDFLDVADYFLRNDISEVFKKRSKILLNIWYSERFSHTLKIIKI